MNGQLPLRSATMEDQPVSGLKELQDHLQELINSPDVAVNDQLFDNVGLQLNEHNTPPLLPILLPPLTTILTNTSHDPTQTSALLTTLLRPLSFTTLLTLTSEDTLISALSAPHPSPALLALSILSKATVSPSSTSILSTLPSLIATLIHTWLSASSVEVGERATQLLGALLTTDCDRKSHSQGAALLAGKPPGQGLLWRRIFANREIYASIFELTSSAQPDPRQRSLAQGRLLRLLPVLASLDLPRLTSSAFPDADAQHCDVAHLTPGGPTLRPSLMAYAGLSMVDLTDDLMQLTVLDFVTELLTQLSNVDLSAEMKAWLVAFLKAAVAEIERLRVGLRIMARREDVPEEVRNFFRELTMEI